MPKTSITVVKCLILKLTKKHTLNTKYFFSMFDNYNLHTYFFFSFLMGNTFAQMNYAKFGFGKFVSSYVCTYIECTIKQVSIQHLIIYDSFLSHVSIHSAEFYLHILFASSSTRIFFSFNVFLIFKISFNHNWYEL